MVVTSKAFAVWFAGFKEVLGPYNRELIYQMCYLYGGLAIIMNRKNQYIFQTKKAVEEFPKMRESVRC